MFPPIFAVLKPQKMQQSPVPAHFCCLEASKNATVSSSRLFLFITQYSNCSSQITKKFKPCKKVAPAVKVIVWDIVFSALGGKWPFWELQKV